MEALAALSVACNIMQVISFAGETLVLAKQLRDEKAPNSDITFTSEKLQSATTELQKSLKKPADAELIKVADEVLTVARALDERLKRLIPSASTSWIRSMGKASAYQLKHKGAVIKISRQLNGLQNLMRSRLLIELRSILKEHQLEATKEFTSLNKD